MIRPLRTMRKPIGDCLFRLSPECQLSAAVTRWKALAKGFLQGVLKVGDGGVFPGQGRGRTFASCPVGFSLIQGPGIDEVGLLKISKKVRPQSL